MAEPDEDDRPSRARVRDREDADREHRETDHRHGDPVDGVGEPAVPQPVAPAGSGASRASFTAGRVEPDEQRLAVGEHCVAVVSRPSHEDLAALDAVDAASTCSSFSMGTIWR